MRTIDTLAHEYGWTDGTILDLTVAKARAYLDAASDRRKAEFRRTVSLQEWSTRVLASVTVAAGGNDKGGKMQKEVAKQSFPWDEDGKGPSAAKEQQPLTEDDDLSFLETGDLSAAEKNEGKSLPTAL